MTIIEGIDVSAYQGEINWTLVRDAGKRFAFIKATEGLDYIDPQFGRNWSMALHDGIKRIAYHFFYDHLSAAAQVDFHHRVVREAGHFVYGDATMVDVEEISVTSAQLTLSTLTEYVAKALHDIDKPVIVYTDSNTWINLLGNPDVQELRQCPLFHADLSNNVPTLNTWPKGLAFLQYSFTGHCPGISGDVDLDRFYGSSSQLKKILQLPR